MQIYVYNRPNMQVAMCLASSRACPTNMDLYYIDMYIFTPFYLLRNTWCA